MSTPADEWLAFWQQFKSQVDGFAKKGDVDGVMSLHGDIDLSESPICHEAIARFESEQARSPQGNDRCSVCPLAEIEACTKRGSNYQRIDEVLGDFDFFVDEEGAEAIFKRLERYLDQFLINLGKIT